MTSLKTSIKTITYLSDIGCLEIQGASLRDKEGIVFVRTGREAGVLIIAELFSEVVTVSQSVPGEQETDITDGIRLSDWYYKYKKSSESNVKDLPE
ncbi:DNA methylase [Escherichia coli]|nr:DNA methylase [Escherichia coli]